MKLLSNLLIACFVSSQLPAGEIVIKGGDALGAKMIPQLAEAYQRFRPAIGFRIEAKGTSTGFEALLEGTAQIGMASRRVNELERKQFSEAGLELHERVVAHDMIVVIVNSANPIQGMTAEQVERTFTGDIESWDEFGGSGEIVVLTRSPSSGTFRTFQELAMDGKDYGARARRLTGDVFLPSEVSKLRNSIGYCGLAYATKDGLKPVAVNGVAPSPETVRDYPISRDLYLYSVATAEADVINFISWVRDSEKARLIIQRVGFFPVQTRIEPAEQGATGPTATPP